MPSNYTDPHTGRDTICTSKRDFDVVAGACCGKTRFVGNPCPVGRDNCPYEGALGPRLPALKDTNPKDAISGSKVPMHVAPPTAVMGMVIGLLNGMLKYGRTNWRKAGVRASVYHDAMKRHLDDYIEGNDVDEDGCDNLYAILANAAILVDARAHGKLNDDRNFSGKAAYRAMKVQMEAEVKRLQEMHAGKRPKHYTIADN